MKSLSFLSFLSLIYVAWGVGICGNENVLAGSNSNHQFDIVHNPSTNEYFVAYVETSSKGSNLIAKIINTDGYIVKERIEVKLTSTFISSPNNIEDTTVITRKRSPSITYNSLHKKYFLVFETYIENGYKYNLYGVSLLEDGSPDPKSSLRIDYSSGQPLPGASFVPKVVYNYNDDFYIVTWLYVSNNDRRVLIQRIKGNGELIGVKAGGIAGGFRSSSRDEIVPRLVFNPNRNEYLMAFELALGGSTQSTIGFLSVAASGDADLTRALYFVPDHPGEQQMHLHDPQPYYNSKDRRYLLMWQETPDGTPDGDSHIYGFNFTESVARVEEGEVPTLNISAFSQSSKNRNAELAYDPTTNSFLAIFESDKPGTSETNLLASIIEGSSCETVSVIGAINTKWTKAHHPTFDFNSIDGNFFVAWEYGNESKEENAGFIPTSSPAKRSIGSTPTGRVALKQLQLEHIGDLHAPSEVNTRSTEVRTIQERQIPVAGEVWGTKVCGLVPAVASPANTNEGSSALKSPGVVAAFVILVLFVLGLAFGLFWVLYLRKRLKRYKEEKNAHEFRVFENDEEVLANE